LGPVANHINAQPAEPGMAKPGLDRLWAERQTLPPEVPLVPQAQAEAQLEELPQQFWPKLMQRQAPPPPGQAQAQANPEELRRQLWPPPPHCRQVAAVPLQAPAESRPHELVRQLWPQPQQWQAQSGLPPPGTDPQRLLPGKDDALANTASGGWTAANACLTPPHQQMSPTPQRWVPSPARNVCSDAECDDMDLEWVVWSPDDVGDWVDALLGAGQGEAFRRNGVDGPRLVGLTDADLRGYLGLEDAPRRARLLARLRVFRTRRDRLARRAAQRKAAPLQPSAPPPSAPPPSAPPPQPGSQQVQLPAQQPPALQPAGADAPARACPSPPRRHLSRSQSAASTLSGGPSVASRVSRRSGASKASGGGGGAGSPRGVPGGSFGTSLRQPIRRCEDGPGPCTYNAAEAQRRNGKASSPGPSTIGRTPRWPLEQSRPDPGPGPGAYGADETRVRASSPKATIGNSPRSSPRRREAENDVPGPGCYSVDGTDFKPASPRATVGNAPRNTAEYIVSPDIVASAAVTAAIAAAVGGTCEDAEPQQRIHVKGGVIGSSSRTGIGASSPSRRSGNAGGSPAAKPQALAPGPGAYESSPPCTARGGVIGSASRWLGDGQLGVGRAPLAASGGRASAPLLAHIAGTRPQM